MPVVALGRLASKTALVQELQTASIAMSAAVPLALDVRPPDCRTANHPPKGFRDQEAKVTGCIARGFVGGNERLQTSKQEVLCGRRRVFGSGKMGSHGVRRRT